jgi:hypothetical protein
LRIFRMGKHSYHHCREISIIFLYTIVAIMFVGCPTVDGNSHHFNKRVIGGSYAPPSKFPWAVSIRGDVHSEESSVVCGATLISERWLLSAAHCFYAKDGSDNLNDLREPSLWHITAGQVLVKLEYENENRPLANKTQIPATEARKPEIPSEVKVQEELEKCQKEQEITTKYSEETKNCWLNLLKSIPFTFSLKKLNKQKEICSKMQKELEKLSTELYKCYDDLDESNKETDDLDEIDKRAPAATPEKYSHYHVERIIIHDKYTPDNIEYDIALIKLDKPLPFNELKGVAAVKLPTAKNPSQFPPVGKNCVIVGWGCTEAGGEANPKAKFAELEVITNQRCNVVYENGAGLNDDHEFCAGFVNKKIGVCPGDSGSGLVCQSQPDQWTVAGVTSATHGENPGSYPGLFTRVSYFVGWINAIMKKY